MQPEVWSLVVWPAGLSATYGNHVLLLCFGNVPSIFSKGNKLAGRFVSMPYLRKAEKEEQIIEVLLCPLHYLLKGRL